MPDSINMPDAQNNGEATLWPLPRCSVPAIDLVVRISAAGPGPDQPLRAELAHVVAAGKLGVAVAANLGGTRIRLDRGAHLVQFMDKDVREQSVPHVVTGIVCSIEHQQHATIPDMRERVAMPEIRPARYRHDVRPHAAPEPELAGWHGGRIDIERYRVAPVRPVPLDDRRRVHVLRRQVGAEPVAHPWRQELHVLGGGHYGCLKLGPRHNHWRGCDSNRG